MECTRNAEHRARTQVYPGWNEIIGCADPERNGKDHSNETRREGHLQAFQDAPRQQFPATEIRGEHPRKHVGGPLGAVRNPRPVDIERSDGPDKVR